MCRGFQQQNDRDRLLKIKAFYLRLSVPNSENGNGLPDSLTLHYLPRINGSPLEIDEFSIRADSPGFVTLHRMVSREKGSKGSVFYGSRERVGVSEGVKFEVYLSEEKVVRGFFRKDEGGDWKLELKCGLDGVGVMEIKEVEVCVAAEGEVAMREIVENLEMGVRRKRRGRCFEKLEEIPEEREMELVDEEVGGRCCCSDCRSDEKVEADDGEVEAGMEGVRWAVDVGLWVACLGVGCLVTVASSKKLRRRRIL